jgi:hypothetical protein
MKDKKIHPQLNAIMHLIPLTQLHMIDRRILQIPPLFNIPLLTSQTQHLIYHQIILHHLQQVTRVLLRHRIKCGISKKSQPPNSRTTKDY